MDTYMVQAPNAPQDAPGENKFPSIIRVAGLGILVLILWYVDKVAVSRLPQGSVWRYIIEGVIIFVGLMTVLSITDRLNKKES
jgi:hypothetical protein